MVSTTEAQRFALARIKANQEHLLMLINEILNFVRLESGRMEYHVMPVSVAQAIADVVSMLGAVATQKQLHLTSVPCAASVMACADPDRVRQILLNLVMKALKFTAGGGTITVSCGTRDEVVAVRVADTGPGIPGEHFESIFEPFVQVAQRLTDNRTGIGLGLPISRDLARAMKGDIMLESKVGVGSCFTLTLPRA